MPKRSPFPRSSLPQAGESLRDQAHDLIFDRFFIWFVFAIILAWVAFVELICQWMHFRMTWWAWLCVAAIFGALAGYRWFQIKPQLHALAQGMRGERMVGRMLEELRAIGYAVFHDIPGDGFNVDHALIGPGGVFAIETKTWSKPEGRRAEIDWDGKRVLADGQVPDRDPVAQAEAVADRLKDLLKRMTDRDVIVRPVVLFPGWWISKQPRGAKVWVLTPAGLSGFLKNEPTRLSPEDIALYRDRLTVHLTSA